MTLTHYQDQVQHKLASRHHRAYLENTAPLCSQKTLPGRFHLSHAAPFIIAAHLLTPADRHQLSPQTTSLLDYKARATWPKLTSSAAYRKGLQHGPLVLPQDRWLPLFQLLRCLSLTVKDLALGIDLDLRDPYACLLA